METTSNANLQTVVGLGSTASLGSFASMSVKQALNYCYANQRQYVYDCGKGGQRQFDCLIAILEDGTIKPSELPDYGMDYGLPNKKAEGADSNQLTK